jgi:hypothetical protein
MLACSKGHDEVVKVLLAAGSDVLVHDAVRNKRSCFKGCCYFL